MSDLERESTLGRYPADLIRVQGAIMNTTAISSEEITGGSRRFNWGAAIAGAVATTAVGFFLLTLGAGVGLSLVPHGTKSAGIFLTLGAIYFFAAQAFGFAVGGYLVGRLIGPKVENSKEEEFRAAAHGFVTWAVTIVAGLVLVGLSSVEAGSTLYGASGTSSTSEATSTGYWIGELFRSAPNGPGVAEDKAEAGQILAGDIVRANGANDTDTDVIARLVSQDAGISMPAALARVADIQIRIRQNADAVRKAASIASLWTAFALLFGAIVTVASAISARWMDDKITFSLAPRR
jgi:hypothetical protein